MAVVQFGEDFPALIATIPLRTMPIFPNFLQRLPLYKLVIHGSVMLRPLLCRGQIHVEVEYTLLPEFAVARYADQQIQLNQ
jgi:hypothetical protein